ncbi:hypothetical protein [Gluconobacter wancherniae]|uniref:hypothetical protein n=1 Tax=Gluconobacter wancherniae TaxID=1307955 RepID=UPI001B8C3B39|nr:hypothetical protein [Gluconobacter wancherniae]MBS1093857.1 hypothetical protein [Gluconobacter wancherniae]
MSKEMSFLGMSWVKGHPKTVILPPGTKEDDLVYITKRQFWAVLQVFEAALEASPETIAATPLLSWLVGFASGSERLETRYSSSLNPEKRPLIRLDEAGRGRPSDQSKIDQMKQSGFAHPSKSVSTLIHPLQNDSGDSVAAGPRNDDSADTSVKGGSGDA